MSKFYAAARPLAERIEKSDLSSLRQLHHALTQNLAISHYAQLPPGEIESMRSAVSEALRKLEPRPRKRRESAPKAPAGALDLSALREPDLFADESRWPRRPYCTNDIESGLRIRPLRQALRMTHLSVNPPHLRVWSLFDIDRPDAETAWQRAELPEPTWTSINSQNGHAHCAWGISVPVLVAGLSARNAPIRFLAAIEAMMRERLQADCGFAGTITKNPAHDKWRILRGPRISYDLSELAASLPGIEKFRPKKRDEEIGLGRNVTLFDKLRKWACAAIRPFFGSGLNGWNAWLSLCNSRALVMNCDFSQPLGGKEVWHLARSVARWTWANTTPGGFSRFQSAQGRKGGLASGKVRALASEDKAATARLMRATGMTYAAIAAEIGAPLPTVARWCK